MQASHPMSTRVLGRPLLALVTVVGLSGCGGDDGGGAPLGTGNGTQTGSGTGGDGTGTSGTGDGGSGSTGTGSDSGSGSTSACTPPDGDYEACLPGGPDCSDGDATCLVDDEADPTYGVCTIACASDCDCWGAAGTAGAQPTCKEVGDAGMTCVLDCSDGAVCPDGMKCLVGDDICVYLGDGGGGTGTGTDTGTDTGTGTTGTDTGSTATGTGTTSSGTGGTGTTGTTSSGSGTGGTSTGTTTTTTSST